MSLFASVGRLFGAPLPSVSAPPEVPAPLSSTEISSAAARRDQLQSLMQVMQNQQVAPLLSSNFYDAYRTAIFGSAQQQMQPIQQATVTAMGGSSRQDLLDYVVSFNPWSHQPVSLTRSSTPTPPPEPVPLGELVSALEDGTQDRIHEFVR